MLKRETRLARAAVSQGWYSSLSRRTDVSRATRADSRRDVTQRCSTESGLTPAGGAGDPPLLLPLGADDDQLAAERVRWLGTHPDEDLVELHVLLDAAVRPDRAARFLRPHYRETRHAPQRVHARADGVQYLRRICWSRGILITATPIAGSTQPYITPDRRRTYVGTPLPGSASRLMPRVTVRAGPPRARIEAATRESQEARGGRGGVREHFGGTAMEAEERQRVGPVLGLSSLPRPRRPPAGWRPPR